MWLTSSTFMIELSIPHDRGFGLYTENFRLLWTDSGRWTGKSGQYGSVWVYHALYLTPPLVFFCVLNISACVDVSMLTARKEGGVVEWIVVSAVRRYSICNEMGATGSGQNGGWCCMSCTYDGTSSLAVAVVVGY